MATQLIEQIGKGDRYHQLRPSIGICLLKGILFPARAAYHHQFRLRTDQGLELTECLEINTLELPKNGRRSDNEAVVVDKIVVKDHEVYRLTILPEKTLRTDRRMYLGPIELHFDVQTGLLRTAIYMFKRVEYQDYRSVGDIVVAHRRKMVLTTEGFPELRGVWDVKSIELNPDLPPGALEPEVGPK